MNLWRCRKPQGAQIRWMISSYLKGRLRQEGISYGESERAYRKPGWYLFYKWVLGTCYPGKLQKEVQHLKR